MKKLLLILTLFLMPASQADAEYKTPEYWVCLQAGTYQNQSTLFLSEVNKNNWKDYKHREKSYFFFIYETYKEDVELKHAPLCLDFYTKKEAKMIRHNVRQAALLEGLNVQDVRFKYKGDKNGPVQKKN